MLTQMLPEQRSTAPVPTSRTSRAGRVGLAVSTTALLAGSTAAGVLLDHQTTPTMPTAATGTAAPGLAPRPTPVPAVAPPITDLGPVAPVTAPAERRVETTRPVSEEPDESDESTGSSGSSGSTASSGSAASSGPTASRDDSTADARADRARERRAEAREQAREQMRDRVERRVRAEVRDWMQERGYGRWADAAGR